MFWFIIPALKTVYNNVISTANQTNPIVSNVLVVSNGWFTILPIFIAVVTGITIWYYVTNRNAGDIEG